MRRLSSLPRNDRPVTRKEYRGCVLYAFFKTIWNRFLKCSDKGLGGVNDKGAAPRDSPLNREADSIA